MAKEEQEPTTQESPPAEETTKDTPAATESTDNSPAMTDEEKSGKKILRVLAAVVFFVVTNAVMINIARPHIAKHFWEGEVTNITLTWIVTGYMLSFGIFNTIDGRLADVFGVRRIFLIGTFILGITSLIIGIYPVSLEFIIVLRVIQGIGCAALPALSTAIIARVIPPDKRGAAMGTIVAVTGIASIVGLFLGGALTQKVSWRAVFFFTSIVLLLLPLATKILPKSLNKTSGTPFDTIGAILLATGVGSLFYSFVYIEQDLNGHRDVPDYASFHNSYLIFPIIGIVCIFLFLQWIKKSKAPLVPSFVIKNGSYLAAATTTALANVSRFGALVMVPQLLVFVHHVKPVTTAFVLLGGELAIFFLSPVFGKMGDKYGTTRPVVIGSVCLIVANIIFAAMGTNSIPALGVAMTIYGIGLSATQTPLMSSVSKILPRQLTGVGMGIFMMLFFIGGGIGSAIWNTAYALQSADPSSWIGIGGQGLRYSNAVLTIGILPIIGLLLVPFHPKKGQAQIEA